MEIVQVRKTRAVGMDTKHRSLALGDCGEASGRAIEGTARQGQTSVGLASVASAVETVENSEAPSFRFIHLDTGETESKGAKEYIVNPHLHWCILFSGHDHAPFTRSAPQPIVGGWRVQVCQEKTETFVS